MRRGEAGGLTIQTDPFGYYPIFVYHKGGVICAGTRTRQMAQMLAALGRPVHRDPKVYAWLGAQGGALGQSGYREIELPARGTTIRIDARNHVRFEHEPATHMLHSDRPYRELLDDARHEILSNLRALASGPFDRRVADLSGGMDSRLVLAAILHEGLHDSFTFATVGEYPNADANVAAGLRARFKLQKTHRGTGRSGNGRS